MDDEEMTVRQHLMMAALIMVGQAGYSVPPAGIVQAAETAERAIEAMLAMLTTTVVTFEPEALQ